MAKTFTFDWYTLGPLNPAKPLASKVLMHYRLVNDKPNGLGEFPMQPGKVRIFIDDGRGGEAFLGEDWAALTPLDGKMKRYLGEARNVVCTRIVEKNDRHAIRGNLFDQEILIQYEIENFKDKACTLDIVEQLNRVAQQYGHDPHGDAEWERGGRTSRRSSSATSSAPPAHAEGGPAGAAQGQGRQGREGYRPLPLHPQEPLVAREHSHETIGLHSSPRCWWPPPPARLGGQRGPGHAAEPTVGPAHHLQLRRHHAGQGIRYLTLKKGRNKLQFSWANTLIDPTSVELRPLEHAADIEVADTVFPGQKPQHLIWNIESKFEGQVKVEVTYFTSGLTWQMDYIATCDPGEAAMKMRGYVRVFNNSGEEYDNAKIRMIVGTINLVEKIADLARRQGIGDAGAGANAQGRSRTAPRRRELPRHAGTDWPIRRAGQGEW